MSKTELVQEVKSFWKKCGGDLSATYEKFSTDLSPSDVYDIILDKFIPKDEDDIKVCDVKKGVIRRSIIIKDKPEKKKEDKDGNRINPFIDEKKETFEPYSSLKYRAEDNYTNATVEVDTNNGKVVENTSTRITDEDIDVFESKTESTLNYESIGFAIGFRKANAKELLEMVNGNGLRLIPALQWLYKQTNEEGLRKRIQELTLDVLFN